MNIGYTSFLQDSMTLVSLIQTTNFDHPSLICKLQQHFKMATDRVQAHA